jgi:ABC-type multidrug transport system fused ATPase/permease subunit
VQRIGASRFTLRQIERQWRLAPIADLCVRRKDSFVTAQPSDAHMKVLLLFIAWCVLLTLSWPIALLALIAAPIVWLLSLPLRLIGVCVESIMALLRATLLLPARVLGHRG